MTDSEKIIEQHERETTLIAGRLLLVASVASLLFLLFTLFVCTIIDLKILTILFIIGNSIRIPAYIYIRKTKGYGKLSPQLTTIYLLIFASTTSAIIGQMQWILFALPILIGSRYYDHKRVLKIGILSFIWGTIVSFLMVPFGIATQTLSPEFIVFTKDINLTIPNTYLGLYEALHSASEFFDLPFIFAGVLEYDVLAVFILAAITIFSAQLAKSGRKIIDDEIAFTAKEAAKSKNQLNFLNTITSNIFTIIFIDPISKKFERVGRGEDNQFHVVFQGTSLEQGLHNKEENGPERFIYGKDLELFKKFYCDENLLKILESEKKESIELRWIANDNLLWVRCKAFKTINTEGNNCVAVTIEDISREKQALQHTSVLACLAKDFDYVCYINVKTKDVNCIHATPLMENFINQNKILFPHESIENLRDSLLEKKSQTFEKSLDINGKPTWFRFKYVLDPNDANGIVFGLLNINEYVLQAKKKKEFEAYKKAMTFTEAFVSSFVSAYYINLETRKMFIFHQEIQMTQKYKETENYLAFFKEYISSDIINEDKPAISEIIQPEYIKKRLSSEPQYSIVVQEKINENSRWLEFDIMRADDKENAIIAVKDVTASRISERQRERSQNIITALSDDYIFVAYKSIDSNEIELIRTNSFFENALKNFEIKDNKIQYVHFAQCIKNLVSSKDVQNFDFQTNRERIRNVLEDSGHYFVDFRIEFNGKTEWNRIDYVLDKKTNNTVLGLRNVEDEIQQQKQLKRTLDIVNILSDAYTGLYYLNLTENFGIILSNDVLNESSNINKEINYSDLQENFKSIAEKLIHPDDRDNFLRQMNFETIKNKLSNKRSESFIFRRLYDGIYKYTEMKIAKAEAESAIPINIAIGFVEIDARYRLEMEQKANINRIMALSNEFESIFDVDFDSENYTISLKKDFFIEQLVREFNLISTQKFFQDISSAINLFVHRDDQKKMRRYLSKEILLEMFNKMTSIETDFRCVLKDKSLWYKIKIVRGNNWPNEHKMLAGIFNNDDYRKREMEYQEQLQNALEQAQAASRAKTGFLNSVSHDIRTPMNAIIGFTNLANKHIEDTALVKDYLSKISKSSDHLLSLINDVLDMSHIESGKMVLNEQCENLPNIINTLVIILQADLDAKNMNFHLDYSDIKNENILCDRLRLNQILLNLISNAVKYTEKNGSISVLVLEKEDPNPDYRIYEFHIDDNGIGISKEFLPTIYDPFTRVQSSTVSGIQGSGLGMAITKKLVNIMGGVLDIQSQEYVGTKVTLQLRFQVNKNHSGICVEENYTEAASLDGKKVLLVEDNALNREIAIALLEDFGLIISSAENGLIAVDMMSHAQKGDFDIILMDIQMPVMDGIEATRKIRTLPNKEIADIPIIALTANAFEEDRNTAIEAGMNDHVSKPIKIKNLITVLKKYV